MMLLQSDTISSGAKISASNDVNLLAVVATAATLFMMITIVRYKIGQRTKKGEQ